MSSGLNPQEFVAGFLQEADEHLHSANRNLVSVSEALKAKRFDPRAVRELFRSLHTIKGLASMVGAASIVDISHEMEGILRTADKTGGRISEAALDLLVKATRVIEERVKAIPRLGVSGIPHAPAKLLEELIQLQSDDRPTSLGAATHDLQLPTEVLRSLSVSDREQIFLGLAAKRNLILIDFEPSPANMQAGLNITSVRDRTGKLAEIVKVTPHTASASPTGIAFYLLVLSEISCAQLASSVGLLEKNVQNIQTSETHPGISRDDSYLLPTEDILEVDAAPIAKEASSVRVDIRKLDEALEHLSELIVTRSKLANIAAKLAANGVDTRELCAVVSENGRQLKRLRTSITQARMVSLSELFQRLPLVVRGLTKNPEKAVDIFVQAGSAEVDKAVADRIFPAIVHLIRNSVDHAIETKAERVRSGKDETGMITVLCDDSSGSILSITVKDDGQGINRNAVARKSGLHVAKNDGELLNQICRPGLSTQDGVTQTSGRGMGMDIVKKTVEMLGGGISLSTEEGVGTTFVLRVPVSITIVDVLSFVSGGQTFVAPIATIAEIVEVKPENLPLSPFVTKSGPQPRLLKRREDTIPFLVLDSVLRGSDAHGAIPSRAMVVNQINGPVAFGVDRMLGQQEVVIRPIDEGIVRRKGMSGAADLGDGIPTIVLDLANIGSDFFLSNEVEA